ncbi:uncharacterized protein LOC109848062 [Asparagus officinalis]|uniref:uncharacterized protein LOC109848062 n=1 Tax=Asparagus officinalis TaxID=4686 RepID=UPI00098DF04E|nr:uncharacterized protein LOC109848062 [Asparagus officinalis]
MPNRMKQRQNSAHHVAIIRGSDRISDEIADPGGRDIVLQESRKLINRNPSEIYLNDAYPCSMLSKKHKFLHILIIMLQLALSWISHVRRERRTETTPKELKGYCKNGVIILEYATVSKDAGTIAYT